MFIDKLRIDNDKNKSNHYAFTFKLQRISIDVQCMLNIIKCYKQLTNLV